MELTLLLLGKMPSSLASSSQQLLSLYHLEMLLPQAQDQDASEVKPHTPQPLHGTES